MEMILGQLQYFGMSLLYGIVLMFVYDLLELFRLFIFHKKGFLVVEDLLFWGGAAPVIFWLVFSLNQGTMRNFFIVSLIGGMVLYRKLVGKRVIRLFYRIISWVFRPYVWIFGKFDKKYD